MNMSLKIKLMISFSTLLLLLTVSLIYVTDKVFVDEFSSYMSNVKEQVAANVVHETEMLYYDGNEPTSSDFYMIGEKALETGILYSYQLTSGEEVICEGSYCIDGDPQVINRPTTDEVMFEEQVDVIINGKNYGTVTLGYYEKFLFSDFEVNLVDSVRNSHVYVGGFFFSIALLVALIFAKTISKPLQQVNENASQMIKGKYTVPIETNTTTTEIVEVVDTLNQLRESLQNQEKIKKQMADNYAHEIRTPLSSISSTLEGISDGIIELDEKRINILIREVERLTAMINNLDNLSRYNTKELVISRSKFNLVELINDIYSLFESDFKQKHVSFTITNTVSDCRSVIFADKEKIRSVFVNLISNAYKYTNENDQVEVVIAFINNRHQIKVIDNGIGIEAKELPHIFEHLYRIDKSRVKSVPGFGIGLSVVKDIVEAHSGKVEVTSVVGEKTVFTVTL